MVKAGPGMVDALIVDAPYSERTHSGHDDGVSSPEMMRNFSTLTGGQAKDRRYALKKAERGLTHRRTLSYGAWSPDDVESFMKTWTPLVRGWIVSLTDDVLFPVWRSVAKSLKRQTFQDVPALIRGMSVRLTGDGPSSWCVHTAVSRPRTKAMASWGTLDGGYSGPSEKQSVVGGKPLWLMESLVRDYTRPGDLVVDPTCGAGTTILAAKLLGRRFIGGDIDASHVEIARERLRDLPTADKRGTLSLKW